VLNASTETAMPPLLADLLDSVPCHGVVLEVTEHV
jgi:hypothetical protein